MYWITTRSNYCFSSLIHENMIGIFEKYITFLYKGLTTRFLHTHDIVGTSVMEDNDFMCYPYV